ncbi:MAG: hypothetical protein ACRDP4_15050 [Nocardioidaceae bacterium]
MEARSQERSIDDASLAGLAGGEWSTEDDGAWVGPAVSGGEDPS